MNRILAWILFIQLNFGDSSSKESSNNITSHPNWKLLNFDECGLSNSDRIIGGKNASMGAYPWIARIGYLEVMKYNEKKLIFRCGGSVINKYYILTAAHCVTNLPKNSIVSRIRLGEHNTETNPDCENSSCNDPYEDFEPAEITFHTKFNTKFKLRNDIALIRLNRMITITDFIRPICMMKGKLLKKSFIGQTAEVAGWGVYDINTPQMSTTLQTVKLPVVDSDRCGAYRRDSAGISADLQLCAGGKIGKDSCAGDSGGPLMKVDVDEERLGPRYYLIGIVSFGTKYCGATSLPGVYTKLSSYLPWILDHLEP